MTRFHHNYFFHHFLLTVFCASTLSLLPISSLSAHPVSHEKTHEQPIDFRKVAKIAIPAVVSIKVKGQAKQTNSFFNFGEQDEDQEMLNSELWQRFFGFQRKGKQNQQPVSGQGSGFLVSADGYILTNSHVVKEMSEILVTLHDGHEFPAKVIGEDANTDIALIKIEAHTLPFLSLADPEELQIGEWVAAIGNPLGLQASFTVGVVSATGRNNLDLSHIEDYIQTDAAINRGNSGGPLLNLKAEVIGMNTAIVTNMATGGYLGIGFAIPSNLLKTVMEDLKQEGSFKRGFLGVTLQPVDRDLAQAFGLEQVSGVLIAEVSANSPAEKGGIKRGDIIQQYNKHTISNVGAFRNAVSMMKPGSLIHLIVLRNGKQVELTVEIGIYPNTSSLASVTSNNLGIEVKNVDAEIASQLGINQDTGVIITKVDPQGAAQLLGIKKGTLILELNKKKISSVEDFNQALQLTDKDMPVLMLIKQGNATRFISIKIG